MISVAGASQYGFGPSEMIEFNNRLYMTGEDSSGNYTLWVSDGTSAGTVKMVVPGAAASLFPANFVVCDGKLFFAAYDASFHYNLWVSDGTAAGILFRWLPALFDLALGGHRFTRGRSRPPTVGLDEG